MFDLDVFASGVNSCSGGVVLVGLRRVSTSLCLRYGRLFESAVP